MRSYVYGLAIAALSASLALPALANQTSQFTGTWKLNVEKSKFSPGPGPKSETVTIAEDGKVTVEGEGADGSPVKWSYTPAGDSAVSIEGMENSTVMEKMSGNTVNHTWKMGTGNETGRGVIAKDGKTMKYTMTGTNEKGEAVHDTYIFEKQ